MSGQDKLEVTPNELAVAIIKDVQATIAKGVHLFCEAGQMDNTPQLVAAIVASTTASAAASSLDAGADDNNMDAFRRMLLSAAARGFDSGRDGSAIDAAEHTGH